MVTTASYPPTYGSSWRRTRSRATAMPRARPRPPSRSTGLSRRRIQDLGGRRAGAQQPRHPILLRLVGVAVVVVRGRLLVIAGEDRARRWSSQVCRSMVPPSVVTVASRYRASPSRKMPSGAGVSSQSAVCVWVEGMPGASRSSRRRGQILSGCVPDIGSCWLSRGWNCGRFHHHRPASGQFASRTGSSSCRCAPTLRPAAGRPGRCAGQPATDRRASPATDPARREGPGGQLACSGRLMNHGPPGRGITG